MNEDLTPAQKASQQLLLQNIQNLARVITTEAGGENRASQTAVGWVVRNRMIRNSSTDITQVWSPAFQHTKQPTASSIALAQSILTGAITDPTKGATHFYTPNIMPKAGDKTDGFDVSGGLVSVSGVSRNGQPIQNYAPACVNFISKPVVGVPEAVFKFYQQPGDGIVR